MIFRQIFRYEITNIKTHTKSSGVFRDPVIRDPLPQKGFQIVYFFRTHPDSSVLYFDVNVVQIFRR
jgi:hypothetical protein